MDSFKNRIYVLIVISLMSCINLQKTEPPGQGVILIKSVLDGDVCNLIINDSVYFYNRKIITDRSLGIDKENWIELKFAKNPIHIKATFEGNIMYGEDSVTPVLREVGLDTVFNLKNGRYLLIEAGIKKVEIGFSRKPIRLN